jgi:hypothetical protein
VRTVDAGTTNTAGAVYDAFLCLGNRRPHTFSSLFRLLLDSTAQSTTLPLQMDASLVVSIAPVEQLQVGAGALEATSGSSQHGVRQALPAGFGSGWHNLRGMPHMNKNHFGMHSASAGGLHAHLGEDEAALLHSMVRTPGEPCQLPDVHHRRQVAQEGGVAGERDLLSCSCSVVAFSPDGLLLAAAVEGAHWQWSIEVRPPSTPTHTSSLQLARFSPRRCFAAFARRELCRCRTCSCAQRWCIMCSHALAWLYRCTT